MNQQYDISSIFQSIHVGRRIISTNFESDQSNIYKNTFNLQMESLGQIDSSTVPIMGQQAGSDPQLPTFKQFKLANTDIEVVFKLFANSTAIIYISEFMEPKEAAQPEATGSYQRFGSVVQAVKVEEMIDASDAQNADADDLDDIDFEDEEEAAQKMDGKKDSSPSTVQATLLMGARGHKDIIELFVQNLLIAITEKYQPNLDQEKKSMMPDLDMINFDEDPMKEPKQPSPQLQYWSEMCGIRHMIATVSIKALVDGTWDKMGKKEVFKEMKQMQSKIVERL